MSRRIKPINHNCSFSNVTDLSIEVVPAVIEIGGTVTLMARVSSGNPVTYIIDWDDGSALENVSRQGNAAVNGYLKLPLLKDRQRFDAVSTSNLEVYKFWDW